MKRKSDNTILQDRVNVALESLVNYAMNSNTHSDAKKYRPSSLKKFFMTKREMGVDTLDGWQERYAKWILSQKIYKKYGKEIADTLNDL